MVRRKSVTELEKAEIKLQSLVERRDALNEEARLLRDERDLVVAKKRETAAALRELRTRRGDLIEEARAHRGRRDEFQRQAKALIELKRRVRTKVAGSVADELQALRREIAKMEMRQQTATLTLDEEKELLDDLRERVRRADELQGIKVDQDNVRKEVRDLDSTITELFAKADREHAEALERSHQAQAVTDEMQPLMGAMATLELEGDEKHEAYLEARRKADEVHAQIVEMRGHVLAEREARRAAYREGRDLLRHQNLSVRRALQDPKKLDASADEALKVLLQKGRVEIGR